MHNAPPAIDLATPATREVGAPDAVEPALDPGVETLMVVAMPSVLFGSGRVGTSTFATDVGLALRFEYTSDRNGAPTRATKFAVTTGFGVQAIDHRPTTFGALYAELNFRSFFKVIPFDVGVGPAMYPAATFPGTGEHYGTELGGQLSLRLPLFLAHLRYMAETGFEFQVGYEVPIPFLFQRSR